MTAATSLSADIPRTSADSSRKLLITIVLMFAIMMQSLDMTIVNMALPHMQASLNATPDQISWVATSFIVANAIAMAATGGAAVQFGRTRLFVIALAGFTIVSVLCGIAQTLPQMVLFRLAQGIFAAPLVPLAQAIILDVHEPHEVGRAMSLWSVGMIVGPILGPTAGGYLTDEFSWRWCFYINLPIGILSVIGAIALIPSSREVARKFDWTGFAFLALAMGCLQLSLDRGQQNGWLQSTEIKIEATLAVFGLYMFVVHSATTKTPFIDPSMFRDRNLMLSLPIHAIVGCLMMAPALFWPQMIQNELNYPVLTAGLVMAPRALGMIAGMALFAAVANRVDPRPLVAIGFLALGAALYDMSVWSQMVGAMEMMVVGVFQGVGMGLAFSPMNILTFTTLSPQLRTEATVLTSVVRTIGGSASISILVSQLMTLTQSNHARLGEYMNRFRHFPNIHFPADVLGRVMLNINVTHQASLVAYVNLFRLMAIVSFLALPIVFTMRRGQGAAGVDIQAAH